jgi:hypothetical protein
MFLSWNGLAKLPSLKIRRIRTIAIETFKIINKETPQYLHDLVTLKNNKYNFRYSNTAHIPTVKSEAAVAWAAIPRVYQTLTCKLIERCFFPEMVWQLIPRFWSIVSKRVQSIPAG